MIEMLVGDKAGSPWGHYELSGITTPGVDEEFVIPAGVTRISAVAVSPGHPGRIATPFRGGMGGTLSYVSNVSVTPGEVLELSISSVAIIRPVTTIIRQSNSEVLLKAISIATEESAGTSPDYRRIPDITAMAAECVGDQFGFGGAGGLNTSDPGYRSGGGGGAAGYPPIGLTGSARKTGGDGASGDGSAETAPGGEGSYGGGGGGGFGFYNGPQRGGGVGLYGRGSSGLGGRTYPPVEARPAGGGSGGSNSSVSWNNSKYGAGGGASSTSQPNYNGTVGGICIIWGTGRSYPDDTGF